MNDEPLAPEEIQNISTKAVSRSRGHSFGGADLAPFTIDRQIAAAEMGLKFGYVSEEDRVVMTRTVTRKVGKGKSAREVSEQERTEIYRQLFRDVILVLWLCSVKNSEALRAQRKPEEAMQKATKWAAAQGLSLLSPTYTEAAMVFFAIMADIENSRAVGVPAEEGDDEDPPPGE